MNIKNELWTVEETAKFLDVKESTLYAWAKAEHIPCVRYSGGMLRFDPVAIRNWKASKTHDSTETGQDVPQVKDKEDHSS